MGEQGTKEGRNEFWSRFFGRIEEKGGSLEEEKLVNIWIQE